MVRGPQNGFFAVALSRGKRDFSDRDALVLNLTLPHLIQGYIAAGRVTQLERELGSLRQGLDAADVGLVLLSDDGRIRLATSRARAWLNEYFDMAARASNRLPPPVEGWVLRHVSQGRSEDHLPAIRRPLIAYRRGKSLSIRLSGGPGDLALVLSEAYSTVPLPGLASLGLSRRETEVLRWVAQGKRNADIGGILGISTATVNHHVEHIHRKLDVETRTAAVACALSAVQGSRPA
jgi:DNA-binding CsgD family transcriptional regulator